MYILELHNTTTAYRVSKMMMMDMYVLNHNRFDGCKNRQIWGIQKFILAGTWFRVLSAGPRPGKDPGYQPNASHYSNSRVSPCLRVSRFKFGYYLAALVHLPIMINN